MNQKTGGLVSVTSIKSDHIFDCPLANGAKLLVYAYGGEMERYPQRRPEWVKNEVGRCERREARRRHDVEAMRQRAVPAMVAAMARREDYLTMSAANALHFGAANVHAVRAAALRYRIDEIEEPDWERESIIRADDG